MIKLITVWGHPFSTCAKFSEKLTFLTSRTCVYQGVKNVSFSENLAYVLNEWPPILQRKLDYYGKRGIANEWFCSYIKKRKQENNMSSVKEILTEEILTGVPQGSVLSPLFFLMYRNDLHESIRFSIKMLFLYTKMRPHFCVVFVVYSTAK